MTTCFGKSSAFGLLCVSSLGDCVVVVLFVSVSLSILVLRVGYGI